MKTPVYLDYQATTPLDPRVLETMMPFFTEKFGNPHSAAHKFGWEGEAAVDIARGHVGGLIGADPAEIIFTSGATEANNLAIKGIIGAVGHKKPHIVTVVSEHKCVLESVAACVQSGYSATEIGVSKEGLIDLSALEDAVTDETALISVMAVNNEIGVIQPLEEIGKIAKSRGVAFHTDAAQAFGKINLDVKALGIDLLSISGHKAYGPKGVGALYCSAKIRKMLVPQMSGGGQEGGTRSGTQAPALVAGLGRAAQICKQEMQAERDRISFLMTRFKSAIKTALPSVRIMGSEENRWAGNISLCFRGINGDLLQAEIRELALSHGSACSSALTGGSYVLRSLGLSEEEIQSTFRIGIGRFTTEEEIEFAADKIISAAGKLGGLKP